MLLRLLVKIATALLAGSIAVSGAGATSQASRYVTTSCCVLKGSRSSIWSPNSSEPSLQPQDFFVSSAYVDTVPAGANSMQAGLTYEFQAPEAPSCNLGSSSRVLYHFVEVILNGAGSCYSKGTAAWSDVHLYSVIRNADGYWRAYKDGGYLEVRTTWSACVVTLATSTHSPKMAPSRLAIGLRSSPAPGKRRGNAGTEAAGWLFSNTSSSSPPTGRQVDHFPAESGT